jgi:hypothetical protein
MNKKDIANTTIKKTLRYFLLIRDEISMLPRPNNHANKKITKSKEILGPKQIEKILISKLEFYEEVVAKIDGWSHKALLLLDQVDDGGRKKDNKHREMVKEFAIKYFKEKGKLPSASYVHKNLSQQIFKKNPMEYIQKYKGGMKSEEVELNSKHPTWTFWKHVRGPISERTISDILHELKKQK